MKQKMILTSRQYLVRFFLFNLIGMASLCFVASGTPLSLINRYVPLKAVSALSVIIDIILFLIAFICLSFSISNERKYKMTSSKGLIPWYFFVLQAVESIVIICPFTFLCYVSHILSYYTIGLYCLFGTPLTIAGSLMQLISFIVFWSTNIQKTDKNNKPSSVVLQ